MGTVGINFGSATSGAGFDVASTVTSILALSSTVETPWKAQVASLQLQDTALTSLGTNLSSLSTAVSALTNFDGVLSAKQGSSSAPNVLTLTSASTQAVAGSHTVTVTSLAATSSTYSDRATSASDVLSGTLTLQVGEASLTASATPTAAQTITIGPGNNTLTSLATYINNGAYGLTASVVTDSGGSRLSLVSSTSGAAGEIKLGGGVTDTTAGASAPVGFNVGQTGADAVLNVDGLPTTSASNTVSGAIPGVTFQLLSASATSPVPVQVQITNDNSSVETAVASLVTAYNAIVAAVKTQEGKDATGKSEPLYGDPTLSLLQTQLSTSLLGGAASGAIKNIQQLGLSVNPDGTLSLDSPTLDSALNAHFADVTGFFQNPGSFGQKLLTTLNTLGTASSNSAVSLALAQNASIEASLNLNVTKEDALIAAEKITLTAELNVANQILQSIPQQLLQINEIYSAITGYNQQK